MILCNECEDENVQYRIKIEALEIKADLLETKIDDLIVAYKIERKAQKKALRKKWWKGFWGGSGTTVGLIGVTATAIILSN